MGEKISLSFKRIGEGYPLIILHGLYGSGTNWLSIARELSGFCEVFLVDQRNHGDSPHDDQHSYDLMKDDVIRFMDENGLKKSVILGHSMGGKTAMWLAIQHPERVSRLIIADISPLPYDGTHPSRAQMGGHKQIMESLLALDLSKVTNLKDAEAGLEDAFPDRSLRQFLLMNLGKDDNGRYFWRINLTALLNNLDELADGIDMDRIPPEGFRQFPVLFLKGEKSGYIQKEDERAIRKVFPLAQVVSLKNAGHWLHAEQPKLFTETVRRFLLDYS